MTNQTNHQKRLVHKRQKTSHNDNAPFINFLSNLIPDDLLLEILLRLPDRRNVIRCSAVCKRWLSVITEPQFGRVFTARHGSEVAALVFQKHEYEFDWSLFDPKFHQILNPDDDKMAHEPCSVLSFLPWEDVVIRASFDDLLLISRPNTDQFDETKSLKLYVCNPVTKKWRGLPPPPRGIQRLHRCGLVCYDNRNSKYKVVVLCYTIKYGMDWHNLVHRDRIHLTVFSSETGRWSLLNVVACPDPLEWSTGICMRERSFNNTVPLNGFLYWLGDPTRSDNLAVFCIDPFAAATGMKRCWQFIRLPDNGDAFPKFSINRLRIGACNGKLRLGDVSCFESQGVHVLSVWELLDHQTPTTLEDPMDLDSYYSNSYRWSLVYEAVLENADAMDIETEDGMRPDCCMLAFHPTDPDVVFVQCDKTYIFRYDMVRRKGVTVGSYPVTEGAPGAEVSTHCLSMRSLWPSQLP